MHTFSLLESYLKMNIDLVQNLSIANNLNQSFENCYGDPFGLAIGNKYFGCTRLGAGRKNSGCSGQNGTIFKTWILTAMVFDSL